MCLSIIVQDVHPSSPILGSFCCRTICVGMGRLVCWVLGIDILQHQWLPLWLQLTVSIYDPWHFITYSWELPSFLWRDSLYRCYEFGHVVQQLSFSPFNDPGLLSVAGSFEFSRSWLAMCSYMGWSCSSWFCFFVFLKLWPACFCSLMYLFCLY